VGQATTEATTIYLSIARPQHTTHKLATFSYTI